MFKGIVNWFKGEQAVGAIATGESNMTAQIQQADNGKFTLVARTGKVVGTYSRKRDAVRGAQRRGLTVA